MCKSTCLHSFPHSCNYSTGLKIVPNSMDTHSHVRRVSDSFQFNEKVSYWSDWAYITVSSPVMNMHAHLHLTHALALYAYALMQFWRPSLEEWDFKFPQR